MENQSNNKNLSAENDVKTETSYLTQTDIKNTVSSFVLAWIRGDVVIDFPDAEQIIFVDKKQGKATSFPDAIKLELDNKKQFRERISVFLGNTPSTSGQKEQAMSDLFKELIDFRCGGRIKGTFGKQDDFEARITAIEERIEDMNNNIQQLIIWYRSIVGH